MFPKLIGPQDPLSFFHYTMASIHQNWYSSKHGLEDPAHSLVEFLWLAWYSTERELIRFREGNNPSCCSVSVMSDSVTPWTAARQASLSFTICWSLLRFMSIELVLLSNHLILCWPLLLPSIRGFSIFSSSHQVAKVLELQLQHQSFQWIFRVDFL